MFCTRQYCFVLHEYFQQEATQSGLPTFPPFSLEQKRWEHVQEEALVKETALNEEVAGPEQRRVLSVGYSQEEDRSSSCCSETERESFPSFSYSVYGRCYRCSLRPFSRDAHHGNVGGER